MQSFLDLYHFTCKASDFSLSSSNVKAKKVDKHRFNTLVWRLYDAKCILIFRASSGEEKKKKKRQEIDNQKTTLRSCLSLVNKIEGKKRRVSKMKHRSSMVFPCGIETSSFIAAARFTRCSCILSGNSVVRQQRELDR